MTAMVLIGLGSNLRHGTYGPPADVLRAAVQHLTRHGLALHACSRLVQSAPMGPKQPIFTNAVILAQTTLAPLALLALLKATEQHFGRKPGRRWGPRVLDLDVLAYDQVQLRSARLTLPHPGMALRPFVLWPACEVAPNWQHPDRKRSLRQLAVRARGRKTLRPAGFL
jgi:2-amino-4-hydroxy-6-hydroxymethyldihydropteridine diphosphokinase